jgi:UDP-N-acetylglucosamine 2-epimerase (non-hydrolysing)
MRVICVVGARPNFIKMAAILEGFRQEAAELSLTLLHSGQHSDERMSGRFFRELGLPDPDVNLGIGPHEHQAARIMAAYEGWLLEQAERPAATLVVGDVSSTMACALASARLNIPVIHVEAGLRSFDKSMPEEIHRIVTDSISDLLLVSEPSGLENLRREGREGLLVGNVMIDALLKHLPRARELDAAGALGLKGDYAVLTLHRPSNVDQAEDLKAALSLAAELTERLPVVFPVHPRTARSLQQEGLRAQTERLHLIEPMGYLPFLSLLSRSRLVLTDSGGIQEETTALSIPCLTLRENTERPITQTEGSNTLVGRDPERFHRAIEALWQGSYRTGRCPDLWDGQAGRRVARAVASFLSQA